MSIATINRFISLFRAAFDELAPSVSMMECERLAIMVHRSMDPKTRSYHTAGHVFFMCEGMNSVQVLAALFHDVVYFQLDGGFPPAVAHTLDVVECDSGVVTLKPFEESDRTLQMCAAIFGFRGGEPLGLYSGLNEFLSALVAARLLGTHIGEADLLGVVAAIEATIPFRVADANGVGPVEQLSQRVSQWVNSHPIDLPTGLSAENNVRRVLRDAVGLSNRDVSGFAQSDPAVFLTSTWLLIEESNAPLKSIGIYSVTQYRAALVRMESFLLSIKPADIFQSFDGVPGPQSLAALSERARQNIEFACDFLDAKIVAIAVVEALAMCTGSDCPVSMFLGDINSPYGRPIRAEEQLAAEVYSRSLNAELLGVFENGRPQVSSYDLTASPLTAFIYRSVGHDAMKAALVQAKTMFDGTLSHREFLNVLDVAVTRHIARACSEIAVSRRDALLELEASL